MIQRCHDTADIGLKFQNIKQETMHLQLYTDATFGTESGCKSRLGFLIALVDAEGNANTAHHRSRFCERVTRSVMTVDLMALIHDYDHAVCT